MPNQIKATVELQKKLKKCHLTARQKAFADLLGMGWIDKDAYQVIGLYDDILPPGENWKEMRNLMMMDEFINYTPKKNVPVEEPKKKTKDKSKSHEISDEEVERLLSKDNQLKELLWKIKNEDLDPQTEVQYRKMIADIQQFKKEKVQVDDKRTTFYLPLQCHQCSLYKKNKGAK